MKVTEGKRLAAMLGAYIAVFSLYILVPPSRIFIPLIGGAILVAFAAALGFGKNRSFCAAKAVLVLLMALSVTTAGVRGAVFTEKTELCAERYTDGQIHSAEGYITKVFYAENYGSLYEARLTSLDAEKTAIGTTLSLSYNGELSVGDIVAFDSVFSDVEHEYGVYRKADGIFLSAEAESAAQIGVRERTAETFFERIRLFMQKNFERYMSPDGAGLATALMTGNRDGLDGHIRLTFARLGISHVLAVSGLHLSIIVGGLDLFLRWVGMPRKAKNLVLILTGFFFACVCGLSPSILRAAIMLAFLYVADTVKEQYDSLTALFIAIFLILFFRPRAVYDVSMWLSFLATLGIVATAPIIREIPMRRLSRPMRKFSTFLLSLFCMTVSATFFTLPITCFAFGGISVISPLANLIFVPLTQLLLYLLVGLTVFGFLPFPSELIGRAAQSLTEFVCATADTLADLEGIYFSLRYPFVWLVLAALTVGILAVFFVKRLRAAHLLAVFGLCIAVYAIGYCSYTQAHRDVSYVYMESDGKSDVVGIVSAGEVALVDISTGGSAVPSRSADRITDFYACEIDLFVVTHYHSYHTNTLMKLMKRVKIHRVLLPMPSTEAEEAYFHEICASIAPYTEIEIYRPDGKDQIRIGDSVLTLPKSELIDRSVHPTVRFSVRSESRDKGLSYIGEGATETSLSGFENSVVIFGSHGPTVKNGLDSSVASAAELVIFAEKEHAELANPEALSGEILFPEDCGGYVKILLK